MNHDAFLTFVAFSLLTGWIVALRIVWGVWS